MWLASRRLPTPVLDYKSLAIGVDQSILQKESGIRVHHEQFVTEDIQVWFAPAWGR
jgi:hypothetical protein